MENIAARNFESHRRHLTGLAYRMLGSVAEAEDVVQDAYLRWHDVDPQAVDNPGAYLSTVVTRLCLDRWKEARRRRETYVGTWLPEPVIDEGEAATPEQNLPHDISFALMLALERLSPLERAAFLLHDVFDIGFTEVAVALDRSETACRQLASRARARVRQARPRFSVRSDETDRLAEAFFAASRSGDAGVLRTLLTEDATLHSDGGGRRQAARNPIRGADRIGRFYAGLARKKSDQQPRWARRLSVNGLPGWLTVEPDGLYQTTALEIVGGGIAAIYVMRNPDKLNHLSAASPSDAGRDRANHASTRTGSLSLFS